MILYNVTVSIDPEVSEEWLVWMRTKHIPDVMGTGCFIEARISRVHGEEEGGMTYAIAYLAKGQAEMDRYNEEFAKELQAEHGLRYNGRFAAFRTMLTVLDEFKQD